jgi:ATP-binding cassette, subfamily C, bacterial CydD
LGIALVAVTVGVRLVDGGLGFQAALTVLLLTPELYAPLRNLAAQFHASADGVAVADRLHDLVEEPALVEGGTITPPSPRDVPVRLEGVRFSYPARDEVLLGVDLVLEPGETVALVGESGVGKSTVGSLLLRLAEPTAGRVVAGDTDLARTDRDAWRRHVAWLPQEPTLFRGTIADNIRLGAPEASDDDVRAASVLAGADAFVAGLPDGYSTTVGDGGRALSAGQRQRVALARTFLRDAPLVILDEPTANLDAESAEIVGDAIGRLRRGRTMLLIVHRPELAARADRIVQLEAGRILEPSVQAA